MTARKPRRVTAVELGVRQIARERGANVAGLALQAVNLLARMLEQQRASEDLLDEARRLVDKFGRLSRAGRQR